MHQKHFVRILLFFYLFSSFVSAAHIHHHDALESHADCKVCIVVKNLHSADVPDVYTFDNVVSYSVSIWELKNTCHVSQIFKGYNAHAPPFFS